MNAMQTNRSKYPGNKKPTATLSNGRASRTTNGPCLELAPNDTRKRTMLKMSCSSMKTSKYVDDNIVGRSASRPSCTARNMIGNARMKEQTAILRTNIVLPRASRSSDSETSPTEASLEVGERGMNGFGSAGNRPNRKDTLSVTEGRSSRDTGRDSI
ncbi:uncharacterized protein A4U43_C06F360 [Asparagus officinalis]|uniref:Uncharacterized protein n=1 Tax=Asparagus officinalis TaxID=4686 RepID=A0A5P1EII8_ASPOF|nr:uncharacterized protein A4U43_C06F360 [Asparagus officinalis]